MALAVIDVEANGLSVELLHPGTGTWRGVLDGATVRLSAGEIVGVTGPSGGGKSTLASALAGLLPESARVRSRSTEVTSGREWNRRIRTVLGRDLFVISQDARSTLFPHRTVEWHLRRATSLTNQSVGSASNGCTPQRDDDVLAELGFESPRSYLSRRPHELSTGECQRVQWAMARRLRPHWLIADEPFASVDAAMARRLSEQLRELAGSGCGVLLISHDLWLLREVAHSVLVLHRGRVVANGSAKDVLVQETGEPSGVSPRTTTLDSESPGTNAARLAGNASEPLVQIEGLTKVFSRDNWLETSRTTTAFRDRSLTIRSGSCVGLAGASGCGKTTLARIVMGLIPASAGRITRGILGADEGSKPLDSASRDRLWRSFQIVHQDTDLVFDPACRLGDALVQVARASRPLPAAAAWRHAGDWLLRFGLSPEMMLAPASCLSGGEKRRAAIVRGLLALGLTTFDTVDTDGSRLLILDEPTVGLDLFWQETVMRELRAVQATARLTYLVISHNRPFLRQFCDDVVEWTT